MALCVLRYYIINHNQKGKNGFFSNFSKLKKGLKTGCKYNKLKFSNTTQKGNFDPIVYRFGGMAEW